MIQSLRNNKNQLRSRSYFRSKEGRFDVDPNDPSASVYGELDCTPATEEQLAPIREKMQRQRRRSKVLLLSIAVVLLASVVVGVVWMNAAFEIPPSERVDGMFTVDNDPLLEANTKYQFYLNDGDAWLLKGHSDNAIFQYKKAHELFNYRTEPLHRLLRTYQHVCAGAGTHYFDCQTAKLIQRELDARNVPDSVMAQYDQELETFLQIEGWVGTTLRTGEGRPRSVVATP